MKHTARPLSKIPFLKMLPLLRCQQAISTIVRGEIAHLLTVNKSRRPWHMPIIAAIAISFPVFVGAYFDALSAGIKASLGAMIVLNLPFSGALPHRLVTVMSWGFAMALCFALGLIAQQVPLARLPVFAALVFGVVVMGRYYQSAPPAGLFIMMAGAIALFIPLERDQIMPAIGLVILGSGWAVLMALLYSLFLLATQKSAPHSPLRYQRGTIAESLLVTFFVSAALSAALMLDLSNPYWASVSCFIIIQGMHLRTIWIKQFHRLLGTAIGIGLASWMLSLGLGRWQVAGSILLMILCIESLVDRHYGLAVIFITPLTIFIAEYGSGVPLLPSEYHTVIQARLVDTALGCMVGLAGAWVIHSTNIRAPLQRFEDKLVRLFGTHE